MMKKLILGVVCLLMFAMVSAHDNDYFVTQDFWKTTKTDAEIIDAFFGDSNTAYSQNWSGGNTCNTGAMSVVRMSSGSVLSSTGLASNTIYVLGEGIISMISPYNLFSGASCSAVVGVGGGLTMINPSNSTSQLTIKGSNNIIIDGVRIAACGDNTIGSTSVGVTCATRRAILVESIENITMNNIILTHYRGGLNLLYTKYGLFNNIWHSFRVSSSIPGTNPEGSEFDVARYIRYSEDNVFNNIQLFHQKRGAPLFNGKLIPSFRYGDVTGLTINNFQAYNIPGVIIDGFTGSSTGVYVNNSMIYNTRSGGTIGYSGTAIRLYSGSINLNNIYVYNTEHGPATGPNIIYHGIFKEFLNDVAGYGLVTGDAISSLGRSTGSRITTPETMSRDRHANPLNGVFREIWSGDITQRGPESTGLFYPHIPICFNFGTNILNQVQPVGRDSVNNVPELTSIPYDPTAKIGEFDNRCGIIDYMVSKTGFVDYSTGKLFYTVRYKVFRNQNATGTVITDTLGTGLSYYTSSIAPSSITYNGSSTILTFNVGTASVLSWSGFTIVATITNTGEIFSGMIVNNTAEISTTGSYTLISTGDDLTGVDLMLTGAICSVEINSCATSTTGTVQANLTGCSQSGVVFYNSSGSTGITLYQNGLFTGITQNVFGVTGTVTGNVSCILPHCSLAYSYNCSGGATTGAITVSVTGCNYTGINVINNGSSTNYIFTGNGIFAFQLLDAHNQSLVLTASVACISGVATPPPSTGSAGGGSQGGGGGGTISRDSCPEGDSSASYYDGECGEVVIPTHDITQTDPTQRKIIACKKYDDYPYEKIVFGDISNNHRANEGINYLRKACIIKGKGIIENNKTFFNPDDNITRAELLKIIVKIIGITLNLEINEQKNYPTEYEDMRNHRGNIYVVVGKQINLINRMGEFNGEGKFFRPDRNITRKETVKMIVMFYAAIEGIAIDEYANPYKDLIDDEFKEYILTATHYGLVNGYDEKDGKYFRGESFITRAELTKIIYKAFLEYFESYQ